MRNVLLSIPFALLTLSTAARAEDCSCADADGKTVVEATTRGQRALKMRFDGAPVTRATRTASLCSEPGGKVTLAKLWMPDMGHGSSPTRLTAVTPTCTRVERISFVMDGGWDIQVSFDDGDAGTVSLEVAE